MLSTMELEEYIKNEVSCRLGEDADMGDIYFQEGHDCSSPGDYIFTKDGKYHFLSVGDRGGVVKDLIIARKEDVLYRVVNLIAFRIALSVIDKIMKENFQDKCIDDRRIQFEKEIEICSLFGEEFKARKCQEIEEVLERSPYEDDLDSE